MLQPFFPGDVSYVLERLSFWHRHIGHPTYQVQVLVASGAALTPDEREQVLAFYEEVRTRLIKRLGPGGWEVSR